MYLCGRGEDQFMLERALTSMLLLNGPYCRCVDMLMLVIFLSY